MTALAKVDAPQSQRSSGPVAEQRAAPGSQPVTAMRSPEAFLLGLQQTAGNRAVTRAMTAGHFAIQRAPKDDDKLVAKGNVTAAGDVDDKPVPSKGPATAVGDADDKPAPVRQPAAGSQAREGGGELKMIGGAVDQRNNLFWYSAKPADDDEALVAFARDPASVIRSPSKYWHWQMWNKSEGPTKYGKLAPRVFRAGTLYAVAPDYSGPATKLPDYRGSGVGLGTPGGPAGSHGGASGTAPAAPPGADDAAEPATPDPMRQAIGPGVPNTVPKGSARPQRVKYQDVADALARDPKSIVRSPDFLWHARGFRIDGGEGGTPGAYKIEGTLIVSPFYPITLPQDASPTTGQAGAGPEADPGETKPAPPPKRRPGSAESDKPPPGPTADAPHAPTAAASAQTTPTRIRPPGVLDDIFETPPTEMTAEELGIVPGSAQDKPQFRANRAEQLRRSAAHPSDYITVQGGDQGTGAVSAGTTADPRAHARAADYARIYRDWNKLGSDGRKASIEKIINAHLAREGIPPVRAIFAGKEAGHAGFVPDLWAMAFSAKSVEGERPSIEEFADLVDTAVHETQHAVTTFRGVRVALANNQYNPNALVKEDIVATARAANDRRMPEQELDAHALGEAFEIYQIQVDPDRADAEVVPQGAVSRRAVLDEKDAAKVAYKQAKEAYDKDQKAHEDSPHDATIARRAAASQAVVIQASERWRKAHNDYMGLPEEGYSWRAGSAVRAAMTERLELETDLANTQRRADDAAADELRWRKRGGVVKAAEARRRHREERELATQISRRLSALTATGPRTVGNQKVLRDVPLSEAEIEHAPRAPHKDDEEFGKAPKSGSARTPGTPTDGDHAEVPGAGARRGTRAASAVRPKPAAGAAHAAAGAPKTAAPKAGAPKAGASAEMLQPTVPAETPGPTSSSDAGGAAAPGTPAPKPKRVHVGADLTEGAKVAIPLGQAQAPTEGTGEAAKPAAASQVAVHINPNQVGANVEALTPTSGGGQHGAVASGSYDFKTGNTSSSTGYKAMTQGGHSASVALTSGNSVAADEPQEVEEGVWEVTYTIADSSGIAAGGSVKAGAVELGAGGSDTDVTLHTGSRRFTSEAEADKFRKNIRKEVASEALATVLPPPTTVTGALMIPEGQARGVGSVNTKEGHASAGFASAALGKSGYGSSGYQISVFHVGGTKVQVTTSATTEQGSAWTASGLGLTNESGGSESHLYAVTYEFDLGNKPEGAAFETFSRMPLPVPGKKPFSVRELDSKEDHDNYALLWGTANIAGSSWRDKVTDQKGEHTTYGGAQTEDVSPGLIMGLFDDEKHARAEIVSRLENGKEAGFAAKFKVSGESGEFNRAQFGKIFQDAKFSGSATHSGEWTLTADIPKAAVHDLMKTDAFRNAKTQDERLRLYSELVKKNGAQMLGGQVGLTSLAWNLELKGDENFPGAKGRAALNDRLMALSAQLKDKPDTAYTVAREAKETIEKLTSRLKAVSDKERYTDLPDGLRKEQVVVIRRHIGDFGELRQRALGVAMQGDPNESLAVVERRAADKHGYATIKEDDRERVQLQDGIRLASLACDRTVATIREASGAIDKVMPATATFSFRDGVDKQTMIDVTRSALNDLRESFALHHQQEALDRNIQILREAMDKEAPGTPARVNAMRPVERAFVERRYVLEQQLEHIMSAGRTLYPVLAMQAMQRRPAFWQSVAAPREEEIETSLTL
jgi:hypothetical protein